MTRPKRGDNDDDDLGNFARVGSDELWRGETRQGKRKKMAIRSHGIAIVAPILLGTYPLSNGVFLSE